MAPEAAATAGTLALWTGTTVISCAVGAGKPPHEVVYGLKNTGETVAWRACSGGISESGQREGTPQGEGPGSGPGRPDLTVKEQASSWSQSEPGNQEQ